MLQSSLKIKSAKITSDVHELAEEAITLLDGNIPEFTQEINIQLQNLKESLQRFHDVVDHPEIIFATTGTTSSGKSTLVNLLCGAFIMPEAVGEKSAGVVEIEHGEQVSVEIFPTKDANWFIGRRDGISDDDLRTQLDQVMTAYNDRREESIVPECPRIKVIYPTRLGREISLFGLPADSDFTLKILDLPGLKFVNDTQNAQVINAYCKRAMSFVTYNAAETDPHKQESLIKQVVGQVKEIGGTPARMMFILNRFDVYENDSNPEESKRRAFTATQKKICEVLARELPEYRAEAEAIKLVRLATKPALMIERGEFDNIERYFGYLVNKEILEELPRKVQRWTDEDKKMFSESVLKACYINEFRESLRLHVANNLPQILFPHAIAELKEHGLYKSIHKITQIIQVVIEASSTDHQKSLDDLDQINLNMNKIYTKYEEKYKSITEMDPSEIPINFAKDWSLDEQEKTILAPLAQFNNNAHYATDLMTSAVMESIISDKSLPSELIDMLTPHDLKLLNQGIQDLKNAGYCGELAEHGVENYKEYAGVGNLKQINTSLNQMSKIISDILPNHINSYLNRDSKRIKNAISLMMNIVKNALYSEVLNLVQDRFPLNQPQSIYFEQKIQPIVAKFEMEAGFPISLNKIKEIKKPGNMFEKIKEYFFGSTYTERDIECASIPSIVDVVVSWLYQIDGNLNSYSNEIQTQLKYILDESYGVVVNAQQQSFDEFKQHLENAMQELDEKFKNNVAPWENLKLRQSDIESMVRSFLLPS